MRNPRELTRAQVISTASRFRWLKKMPKWTVIVENRELPARPLVLEAAGVPPNDPTNSHQAIAILENLGFETRCGTEQRKPDQSPRTEEPTGATPSEQAPTDMAYLMEMFAKIREGLPEDAWEGFPADFSKNVDHYLYGTKREEE